MTDDQNKANEVEDPADKYTEEDVNFQDAETAESDDSDVKTALERETQDGKGGAVVPAADFESYATDEVEPTDDQNPQDG